jgi:hypothetical protein
MVASACPRNSTLWSVKRPLDRSIPHFRPGSPGDGCFFRRRPRMSLVVVGCFVSRIETKWLGVGLPLIHCGRRRLAPTGKGPSGTQSKAYDERPRSLHAQPVQSCALSRLCRLARDPGARATLLPSRTRSPVARPRRAQAPLAARLAPNVIEKRRFTCASASRRRMNST